MKRFIGILMCILILFCPFLKVEADEVCPKEMLIDGVDKETDWYYLYDDYVLYGLDVWSTGKMKGDNFYVEQKEEADAGLRYILDNGFPNKQMDGDITGGGYSVVTVVAIINYMIKMGYVDTEGEYKGDYQDFLTWVENNVENWQKDYEQHCTNGNWNDQCETVKLILDLLNKPVEIQKKYEENYTDEIILNGDSELKKSEDGKYYETGLLSVQRSDVSEYSVELNKAPEDALAVDKNGNEKTKFNINDEFKIKVPVDKVNSNQINVKIDIDDSMNTYYIYKSKEKSELAQMLYKTLSLDDEYLNLIYSKPCKKTIKDSKEFYLDIKADSIVSVPPTAAYIPLIILCVGLLAIILSFTIIMKKVKNNI